MTNQALVPGDIEQRYEVHEWRNGLAILPATEKGFDTWIVVDNVEHIAPVHKVDCYKNRERWRWNRTTRTFDDLGRGLSYGSSTTHMAKLRPRLDGRSGGRCPITVFGIRRAADGQN
jgi:hypothetical protein